MQKFREVSEKYDFRCFSIIFVRFGHQIEDYKPARAALVLPWRDGSICGTRIFPRFQIYQEAGVIFSIFPFWERVKFSNEHRGVQDKQDVLPFLRMFCPKHPNLAQNLMWPDSIRRKSSRPATLCGKSHIPWDIFSTIPVAPGSTKNY